MIIRLLMYLLAGTAVLSRADAYFVSQHGILAADQLPPADWTR